MKRRFTTPDADASLNRSLGQLETDLVHLPQKLVLDDAAVCFTSSTAGDPFVLPHTMGTRPTRFSYEPYDNFVLYATEDDQKLWSEKQVVLRGTVANRRFRLTLFKD